MNYGGIGFEHVWAYQIKCMMANQYDRLIEAIALGKPDLIIAVCLRLGWNDAFRHVSKNVSDQDTLSECVKKKWLDIFNTKNKNKRKVQVTANTANFSLKDDEKDDLIYRICISLVDDFKKYAILSYPQNRCKNDNRACYIDNLCNDQNFKDKFKAIKDVNNTDYPLCPGHIQKMFAMAMKLLLCLIISAEQPNAKNVKLGVHNGRDIFLGRTAALLVKKFDFNNIPFAFDTADCPIDSIILEKIQDKKVTQNPTIVNHGSNVKFTQIVWSKFGTSKESLSNYSVAQNEIEQIYRRTGKCNLCFDFENWN